MCAAVAQDMHPLAHACLQGSLAKLAGEGTAAYVVLLCTLGVAVLAVLSINRVAKQPPYLWGLGMVSCIVFGLTLVNGRAVFPIDRFWNVVVASVLLSMVLAVGVVVLVSLLVVPSLASDEVRGCMCARECVVLGRLSKQRGSDFRG